MKVATRAQIPGFEVMSIVDKVTAMRAEGQDVISLCVGEPGGGAPHAVNELAARLHAEQSEFGYTPTRGLTSTRLALAGHYQHRYGLRPQLENIVMTTGSSGAFQLAFLAAFDVGDVVALARPGYPAYANILSALGLKVIDLPTGAAERYQPTIELLEAARTAHGRLDGLVIASPNNPTGTMLSEAELETLASWCHANGVRLISDEIYHGIEFDPTRASMTALKYSSSAIVVSSFSKYWGMTGWRLGWLLLPDDLVDAVDALASSLALCAPAPAQQAVLAAFEESSYAEAKARVAEFARTRALVLESVEQLGLSEVAPADGAFYLYGRLNDRVLARFDSAHGFCTQLLGEAQVALTPGGDFDPFTGEQYIRLSFAAGYEQVQRAIGRVQEFLSRHLG